MSTRGIRNNNPANIRRGCNWKGLAKEQTDKEFCQFVNMRWGVRALLVTLRTYVIKHHLHTVREIITRWAPPEDGNVTNWYIKYVEQTIKEVDAQIALTLQERDFSKERQYSRCTLYLMAKAMCKMESEYSLSYEDYICAIALM